MQNSVSRLTSNAEKIQEYEAQIQILKGEDVLDLLSDVSFGVEWDKLFINCTWGTVFQNRKYANAWYTIYKETYLPILVIEKNYNLITGIFALARDVKGVITGVGGKQAEYHVWLTNEFNLNYINNALHEVLIHFPGSKIDLKYVPGTAPIDWINTDRFWIRRSVIRKVKQPLIRIDGDNINREFKKKNRREKINRLKRIGELSFERISNIDEFSLIFDQLALQYDFRKEAMFNSNFFIADPLRKRFLIALFNENLLHTTIMRLNGKIIASNVSATDKKWVHLQGINSHDPFYAKYSPGILHLLFVCNLLAKEGVEVFDLTPGSDTYKDNLATDNTASYHIIITSIFDKLKIDSRNRLINGIKNLVYKFGISASFLKHFKKTFSMYKNRIKTSGIKGVLQLKYFKSNSIKLDTNHKIFCICDSNFNTYSTSSTVLIKSNSLSDLLDYAQQGLWPTRWEFLEDAMRRLERGECSYTWSQEGILLACVWLSGLKPVDNPIPADSAVLQGLYYHSKGYNQLHMFLQSAAAHVRRESNHEKIYVTVNVNDKMCKNIDKIERDLHY